MDRKLGACDRWSVGGWRRGAKQGGDHYAPLRLYQFTVKDYVRFDLQSSEDGGTWKTQLAGAENV